MKLLKIVILALLYGGMQNVTAKRMNSSLYVGSVIGKAVSALENDVKMLERVKNSKVPEGTSLEPLSADEIQSLDSGIGALKRAINVFR